jgi:glycine cleavage system regulatory protein
VKNDQVLQELAKPMEADVYAGDIRAVGDFGRLDSLGYHFEIEAEAEPDVFGRIANLFSMANVAPLTVQLSRNADLLMFSISIAKITSTTADAIQRELEQLTTVLNVKVRSIVC